MASNARQLWIDQLNELEDETNKRLAGYLPANHTPVRYSNTTSNTNPNTTSNGVGALPSPTQLPSAGRFYESRVTDPDEKRVGSMLDSLNWGGQQSVPTVNSFAPSSSALGGQNTVQRVNAAPASSAAGSRPTNTDVPQLAQQMGNIAGQLTQDLPQYTPQTAYAPAASAQGSQNTIPTPAGAVANNAPAYAAASGAATAEQMAQTKAHDEAVQAMSENERLAYFLDPQNKFQGGDRAMVQQMVGKMEDRLRNWAPQGPQGYQEYQNMAETVTALKNRISVLQAMTLGFVDSFQGLVRPAQDAITNMAVDSGNFSEGEQQQLRDAVPAMERRLEASAALAPESHTIGRMGGEMVKYGAASYILPTIPGVGTVLNKGGAAVSNALGKLPVVGKAAAGFITPEAGAALLGDTILDTALDTVPNVVVPGLERMESDPDYTGLSLAGDIAQNQGINLLANLAGEYVGQRLGSIGKSMDDTIPTLADTPASAHAELVDELYSPNARASQLDDAARQASRVPEIWDSAIDANPTGHTAAQNRVIADYMNAADPKLASYYDNVLSNPGTYQKPFELGSVNAKQADDLAQIVGFDASGYRQVLDPDTVRHIDNRHGISGVADHSMANLDDVARMQYVLDNYDKVSRGLTQSGKLRMSWGIQNSDGSFAPTVVYEKAINGTYYIVEAVPNNKKKTLHIVSAYIGNNDGGGQASMFPDTGPSTYARSELASTAGGDWQVSMPLDVQDFDRNARSELASLTADAFPYLGPASSDTNIPQLGAKSNVDSFLEPWSWETPEADLSWAAQRRRDVLRQDLRGGGNLDDLPGPGDLPSAGNAKLPDDMNILGNEYTELLNHDKPAKRTVGVNGAFDTDGVPGYTPEGFTARAQDNMQNKRQWAYQQFVSGQAPLENLAKSQDPTGATLNDYAQQVRNAGGTVDYIAERGLVDRSGNPIGQSWKEFTEMSATDSQLWNEYMLNRHNIARRKRDIPVLDSTGAESAMRANELARLRPDLAEKAAEFQKYNDAFTTEWAVNGNLVSPEQYALWKKTYPDYVPTYRRSAVDAANATGGGTNAGGRRVGTPQPLKGAVGSLEEIVPVEDAFMMQVNKVVRAERKNELLLDLYNLAKTNPEATKGKVEILPAHASSEALQYLQRLNPEEFVGQLDDMIIEAVAGNRYRATAFMNGSPIQMEVSQDVYNSLKHLFGQYFDPTTQAIMNAGQKVTAVPKSLITGYNPNFAARNLIRDVSTGYTNSITDKKFMIGYLGELGSAGREMAKGSDDFKLFLANGGARSGFYNTEKGFTRSAAPKKGVAMVADKIKGGFEFLGNNSETLSRFAEFKRGLDQFGRDAAGVAKAMQAAGDVTVNFARSGPLTKVADSWVMYLNAAVQGLDKTARTLKAHPGRTFRRTAEAVAVPAAMLWMFNKDNPHYQDLNNRTKDAYFLIPNIADLDEEGNAKTFIKLPKNREYGAIMGATLERALRVLDGEDAVSAFDGLGSAYADNYGLSNPMTENALAPLFFNLPMNKDWAGRTIVPYGMQDLEPRYQYDYTTSAPAKALGNALNWSPKQIDYLFDQYGGFVADVVQPMTNQANQSIPEVLASPWTQAFVANPLYSSNVTDQFYNELATANTAASTRNFVEDIPDGLRTPEDIYARQLGQAQREISDLRQEEHLLNQEDLPPAERVQGTEALREGQVEIARAAAEQATEYTDAYRSHYEEALGSLHQSGAFSALDEAQTETAYKFVSTFADEMADNALNGGDLSSWTARTVEDATQRGMDVNQLASEYAVLKALNGGSSDMKIVDAYNAGIGPQQYLAYKDAMTPDENGRVSRNQSARVMMQMGLDGDALYDFYTIQNPADEKALDARAAGIAATDYLSYNIIQENFAAELGKSSLDLTESAMLTLAVAENGKMSERQALDLFALNNSEKTAEKLQTAQEWGVPPTSYLTYMTRADGDGNGSVTQQEAINALNSIPLSQEQKAQIFYLQNSSWKARPFGYWQR